MNIEHYRPRCFRFIKAPYFRNKLRSLVAAGVDIDKLPSDMALSTVMRLTIEDAKKITEKDK